MTLDNQQSTALYMYALLFCGTSNYDKTPSRHSSAPTSNRKKSWPSTDTEAVEREDEAAVDDAAELVTCVEDA